MAQIKTGTVAVTNGSNVVTGTGTTWLTDGVQAGDGFVIATASGIDGAGVYYTVGGSVTDTGFQLASNWAGATDSGLAYVIVPDFIAPGYPQLLPGDLEAKPLINQNVQKLINDKASALVTSASGTNQTTAAALDDRLVAILSGNTTEPTHTVNPQFNTTSPDSVASFNAGGKEFFPNRLGHEVAIERWSGSLPATFDVPVSFTVTETAVFRNVVLIALRNGAIKVFLQSELTITGYGTSTISITPEPAELSGSTEVTAWVIGDNDQFKVDAVQHNLMTNFGGYDNITNRQQSYNMGAHNVIDGLGDHQTIWGATYSLIDSQGSYNTIVGGTNNQITGASATSSFAAGQGIRVRGVREFIGGRNCNADQETGYNFAWGDGIWLREFSKWNAAFGHDGIIDPNSEYNLLAGDTCRAFESYGFVTGDGCQVRNYTGAIGQTNIVSSDWSWAWGFNGLNSGQDYSSMGGYQPVVRNPGSEVFGGPGPQGENQSVSMVLRANIASGAATFTKLENVSGATVINVGSDDNNVVVITARIALRLSTLPNYADIELKALWSRQEGLIGDTATVLHSVGSDVASVDARIIATGGAGFYVEVTTGTTLTGVATAKLEFTELV